MIDLKKCSTPPQLANKLVDYERQKIRKDIKDAGGIKGFIRLTIERSIEWYALKYIVLGLVSLMATAFSFPALEHKAEQISDAFASGGYGAAAGQVFAGVGVESELINTHPAYDSPDVKKIETDKGIDFKKTFWLISYRGADEEDHPYFLMREPIKNAKGELIQADRWNFVFEDADSICSQYGGFLPVQDMVETASRRFNLIRRPKGAEMFADSKEANGYFRCVVDPNVFQVAK